MFLGCYELWMLRFWMLRILDATVLDALIASPNSALPVNDDVAKHS